MSQRTIKKSSSSVPPADQLRLMCGALRGLEADPAIVYARWVQQTSTRYVCGMGITATGAYSAYMEIVDCPVSSHSSNRVFSITLRSQDTVTSPPVSDTKTENYDTNATSIATAPANTPSTAARTPIPVQPPPTSVLDTKIGSWGQSSSLSATCVVPLLPGSQTRENFKYVSFLGRWSFPKGPDGKERRWRQLTHGHPPLARLGTHYGAAYAGRDGPSSHLPRIPGAGGYLAEECRGAEGSASCAAGVKKHACSLAAVENYFYELKRSESMPGEESGALSTWI
ncbi:hypothetical protein C7212DRAFT_346882 [Tuber magnatum]|uniref:Uncharacterized protein n=1 Tax=Tuber magnatum TaxID=42249 RepID=A0A317SGP2_9PEZI|nr:hypothetical protein C7212DRAFT_346882 [Tuber magnatum]